ncbi:MAG: cyclase family protein [Chloroflexota bacterium]|nr:cyclase family protein [Chloroflexota bacterium]MDE2961196.1 cyclase family protein [Chloroflexota bacterium]
MERPERTIAFRRVVDLTHPVKPGIPLWPGDPPVQFETTASIPAEGYFLRRFSMGEHSGTHISMPSALFDQGLGPDSIPPEALIAPAVVIDSRSGASMDPDHALSVEDFAEWERRHGKIAAGSIVLLLTGWGRYWDEPERFINLGADGLMHTPGFSSEAVTFLLEERAATGIGIDTHGVDAGRDTGLEASRAALSRGALVLECLNNLDQLPATGATLVVGRLPLVGGSGSPASVLALAP